MAEEQNIPIYIMGKRYDVPPGLTILKAMEFAGYQLIRGCGCRGGVCGACGTVFRMPGSHKIEIGLACQTVVEPEMRLAQLPFFPARRAVFDIEIYPGYLAPALFGNQGPGGDIRIMVQPGDDDLIIGIQPVRQ